MACGCGLTFHAVCFELFYCCTPALRVDYELNTCTCGLRMCPVYEWHTLNTFLIPRHDCFNSAQAIHMYVCQCTRKHVTNVSILMLCACNRTRVRSWGMHGQFIRHQSFVHTQARNDYSILVSCASYLHTRAFLKLKLSCTICAVHY